MIGARQLRISSIRITPNRHCRRSDVPQIGEVVTQTEVGSLAEVPADHFTLIRSVLKPTGAEYTPLENFPLLRSNG